MNLKNCTYLSNVTQKIVLLTGFIDRKNSREVNGKGAKKNYYISPVILFQKSLLRKFYVLGFLIVRIFKNFFLIQAAVMEKLQC
jgi:hypothetical protein